MKKGSQKNIDFSNLLDIQSEPRYSVDVLKSQKIATDIILHIERPNNFKFQPGQYIWLVLPKRSKKHGVVDRHAYSISSSKDDTILELVISITESDYSENIQRLKKGDKVEIIGPMGSAFIPPPKGAIIITGGVGIAPFLSILRSKTKGEFSLYGFENPEKPIYMKDEIIEIAKSEDYTAKFFSGFVKKEHLYEISIKEDSRPIFISGPQEFVDEVTSRLISQGIKPERMQYESVYPENNSDKILFEVFQSQQNESWLYRANTKNTYLGYLEHIFFQITAQTDNHVVFTNKNGIILYTNKAAERITGYTSQEMFGQTPRLWGGLMEPEYYKKEVWNNVQKGTSVRKAILNRRKNGALYTAIATITPIFEEGSIIGYVATEEDVSALHDIDKAKSELISLASHQLRTPLTSIAWNIEIIQAEEVGDLNKQQKEILDEVYDESKRMIKLINSFLNIYGLEIGKFTFENKPLNIIKLIKKVIEEQKSQISEKGINFSSKFEKDIPSISSDEKFLHMAIENILSNAVKYTPKKGEVSLEVKLIKKGSLINKHKAKEDNIVITVSDNGFGIPLDQQDKIFNKFFRASNAKKEQPEGSGMGLYITKRIIENFDGQIEFKSKEKKGTKFQITLPIKK